MAEHPEEQKSRLGWLWTNKLYATTTLTGYAFINDAKRLYEVIIWYGFLLLFTGFTANNVRNLVNRYNSNPTRTEVLIGSNATDAVIKNFTLRLKLPMAEIYDAILQWGYDYTKGPFHCHTSQLLFEFNSAPRAASHCLLVSLYPLVKDYDPKSRDYTKELGEKLDLFDGNPCKSQVNNINQSRVSTVQTEQVLEELESRHGGALTAAWDKLYDLDLLLYESRTAFQDGYERTSRQPPEYLALYLLLSAMSEGEDMRTNLPFLGQINTTAFFQTAGLSPNEVIDLLSERLWDIAPFKLPEELDAVKMVLREWKMQFRDTNVLEESEEFIPDTEGAAEIPEVYKAGYSLFGDSFVQEYMVQLPDGVKEFSMDIFPPKQLIEALFVVMHLDKYLNDASTNQQVVDQNTLIKVFQKLIYCDGEPWSSGADKQKAQLDFMDYFGEIPRRRFLELFFDPILDFYASRTELELDSGNGYIIMQPFTNYQTSIYQLDELSPKLIIAQRSVLLNVLTCAKRITPLRNANVSRGIITKRILAIKYAMFHVQVCKRTEVCAYIGVNYSWLTLGELRFIQPPQGGS